MTVGDVCVKVDLKAGKVTTLVGTGQQVVIIRVERLVSNKPLVLLWSLHC